LSQRGCDENHVSCDSFAADDPVSPAGLIDRDGRSRGEIPTPPKVRRGFLDCNSKDSDLSKEEFDVATDKTFFGDRIVDDTDNNRSGLLNIEKYRFFSRKVTY
jgi:hypothetical protein